MTSPRTERPCTDCGQPFTAGPYAKYGPCCRWKHRGKPALYVWTPERDQVLRGRYDGRVKGRADELAGIIGWPKWAITRRAQQLGLAYAEDRADWTPRETAFLWQHAGSRTTHWIARHLPGRTETAVVLKLKRMRISARVREGYTLRELELCFGCDHRVIERWVRDGKLAAPARRHGNGAPRDAWLVTDAEILRFITEHPLAFELRRVEQTWFLDLITSGGLIRKALADERALEAV